MLKIGVATRNIVPDRPAMVHGQMHVRIATEARDPLTLTAVAFAGADSASGHVSGGDRAILISLDVAMISEALMQAVRDRLASRLPEVPSDAIVMTATHTHTSLVIVEGFYTPAPPGVMTPTECAAFLADRAADAAVDAWAALAPCKIARAFGHAVVAHNRRPVFADGSAEMYGHAPRRDFRWIEGPEDHTLDMIFVLNDAGALAGMMIDLPCPSQLEEGLSVWSADFWHEARAELRSRFGESIWVLPLCGISGDQSPHFIFDSKQEAEMRARRGISERQEVAQRIADAVGRALACTTPAAGDTVFAHRSRRVALAGRKINKKERDWHEAEHARTVGTMDQRLWWPVRLRQVVEMFDGNVPPEPVHAELHFFRIGDAVIATNPFELFVDFGLQIKARSAAAQTLLVQLTAGSGYYLPTQRGVDGGGYGSIPVVSIVGPEGGQELVEHTLDAISQLFPAPVAAAK